MRTGRLLRFLLALHGGALAFAACDSDGGADPTCEPGTNVFCRCPGGDAGTRACLEDGEDFGECVIAPGIPCGDRVECEPFSTIPCLCPDGIDGVKECLREGNGYASCKLPSGEDCPESSSPTTGSTTTGTGGSGTGGTSGAGANSAGCHNVCETGPALAESCDPCAAAVCSQDDYCCTNKWDSVCVDLADQECDNVCNPVGTCEHDVCETGPALTDSCDPCVASVCTQDGFCCDMSMGEWDATCVDVAKDGAVHPDCSGTCCAHSECNEGAKLDATCSFCAESVCNQDSFCCDNEWDGVCVQIAQGVVSCNC